MSPFVQHTLARPVQFQGVGLHTGATINVTMGPAPIGAGVRFMRSDVSRTDPRVVARGDAVCQTRLGTVIGNSAGVTVATVEHLMAALAGLHVDNVVVDLDGPEVPILDGSCAPFVALIDRAGRRQQAARRRYVEILETVEVTDSGKSAALVPSDGFAVAVEIDFESGAIGRQRIDLVIDEAAFRTELASCRTFGFRHEVEALREAGLARGGSLDNAVVIDGDTVLNPEGLRRADEFVRHKALDAIGDLHLLGAPILGRYEGRRAGHGLNNALVRALIERPAAWRFATPPKERMRAV